MAESGILNHAARILKLVQTGTPADQALRESLTQDRHFTAPAERRGISRAVFAYYRWWRWLDENDSAQKRLAAALELQKRFATNPAAIKPEALAAKAVPGWLWDEMDFARNDTASLPSVALAKDGWLAQLQREPALWIRAKVFNFRAAPWEGGAKLPTKTKFDGILVDAPCTGIGTWQRNPHARWTAAPKDVHELAAVQAQLLNHVAGSLKPGGRLVYAVCTLTRAETTAVAAAFTAAHPELGPVSAQTLWPQELNANGMFIAQWRRK